MSINFSFREFLEYEKIPSGYLGAIQDELGISFGDVSKSPHNIANFSIGGNSYNLSGFKILNYIKNADGKTTHCRIMLDNDPAADPTKKMFKKDSDDKLIRIDTRPDRKSYTITIDQLNKALTQGLGDSGAPAPPMM
jgi:hypothetical protein